MTTIESGGTIIEICGPFFAYKDRASYENRVREIVEDVFSGSPDNPYNATAGDIVDKIISASRPIKDLGEDCLLIATFEPHGQILMNGQQFLEHSGDIPIIWVEYRLKVTLEQFPPNQLAYTSLAPADNETSDFNVFLTNWVKERLKRPRDWNDPKQARDYHITLDEGDGGDWGRGARK
jgi:hypothetical protein